MRQGPDPNLPPEVRDASTVVALRDGAAGVEVFCVERRKGGFLGGAVVFPGGKVDPSDLDPAWAGAASAPRPEGLGFAADELTLCGLAVAACREALEEAALLPVEGAPLPHAERVAWRARIAAGQVSLRALLSESGRRLALGALHPFARWITPVTERRRFDTRFFLWHVEDDATGVHDGSEVTDSFWATPADLLQRFEDGSIQLAPPTHRTLATLAPAERAADAIAMAAGACLDPICPRFVALRGGDGDSYVLVLPGDPEHDVKTPRCPGPCRFVLRDGRFRPSSSGGP